jgi:hypothetical protein
VYFDREGNALSIWFDNPKKARACEQFGDDAVLVKDRRGGVIGNPPICSPSQCALTTAQYPQRWRITSYLNNRADNAVRGVANWLDPPRRWRALCMTTATPLDTSGNGIWAASGMSTTRGPSALTVSTKP